MVYSSRDTIFALATPPGMSAVAIIRISGAKALEVPALFGVKAGPARQASRAFLKDRDGAVVDDVMLVSFRACLGYWGRCSGNSVSRFSSGNRRYYGYFGRN